MTKHRMIVISGLRRSGTTALWECFRHHAEIAAFDEPFHPRLAEGARSNPKGTWRELSTFLGSNDSVIPQAIAPLEELEEQSSAEQADYLQSLSAAKSHVAIDVVRCWNRLPSLYPSPTEVLTVQLVRDPLSWVTGHLLPSGKGTWKKALADRYRRASFFSRKGFFDNYHYETIISEALRQDHALWRHVKMTRAQLSKAPAYIKLLAFWWGTNVALFGALRNAGAPCMITTLQDLSANPGRVTQSISEAAGWPAEWLNHSHITATRNAVGSTSGQWTDAAAMLGIPEAIVQPGGADAGALECAFEAAAMQRGQAA